MRTTFEYEDFALRIDSLIDGFRVRLVRSPFGPREESFSPPYSSRELAALLDSLARALASSGSQTARHLRPAPMSLASESWSPEAIGDELFRSIFKGSILQCFTSSLHHVENLPNTGLRVRLELDPTQSGLAFLGALPWELMYRAETRDYLSRNLLTPVVRYLDVSHLQIAPPPIHDQLRILVHVSSPEGVPRLDHESELARIESAWGQRADIRIIRPERPTLRALRGLLRDTSPHVLHFIGHGNFEPTTGHGSLLFEDAEGRPHPVTGGLLAETLKIGHRIRLVFLNSCTGARYPRQEGQDPYHGVASALLMGGVASVLAMQFAVSDRAAVDFSDAFYDALAAGDPIESAVAEGRLAVLRERPDSWEWATPALYMGVDHGRIFPRARTDADNTGDAARRFAAGLSFLDLKQYDAAVDAFQASLAQRPREAEAYYYLALSRMGGKQPRTRPLDLVRKAEDDLRVAIDLDPDQAHFSYLWALVKQDFYPWNGLRIPPPPIEELLSAAGRARANRPQLRQLLESLPTSRNPVRDAIEVALGRD